jgi:hypothetical protein
VFGQVALYSGCKVATVVHGCSANGSATPSLRAAITRKLTRSARNRWPPLRREERGPQSARRPWEWAARRAVILSLSRPFSEGAQLVAVARFDIRSDQTGSELNQLPWPSLS